MLQSLLAERISIRDLAQIVEAIEEAVGSSQRDRGDHRIRACRLARQISNAVTTEAGYIPILTLSPEWEQAFAEALVGQGDQRQLAMACSKLQEFITGCARRSSITRRAASCRYWSPRRRRAPTRSIIERFRPATVVLSQNEIHPKARLRTLGQV